MYKIWRSSYSHFSGYTSDIPDHDLMEETITADNVYTDSVLAEIAEAGFNAIWIHGLIHHIVSVEPLPELGKNSHQHLSALKRLIQKALKYGIKIFIHMQPPRAIPISYKEFWQKYYDIGGEENVDEYPPLGTEKPRHIPVRALCTSTVPVKQWLINAMSKLVQELPLLGGVTVITASEFYSHCYTRRVKENPLKWAKLINCPRCKLRQPEEVAGEIISLMCQGAHQISPEFAVIAWNWSWNWNSNSYLEVIRYLPQDAILMVDFERGGIKDIPGKKEHLYDEYSLAYSGPSQRFMASFEVAEKYGLKVMAKLQLGTTHELPSVVSLPVLGNLFDKALFLKNNKLAGFMGCWNFGNMISANTAGFNYFLSNECPVNKNEALEVFASKYFPECNAVLMRIAWNLFAKAMEYFPFNIAFLYHGPHSHTLAYKEIYVQAPLTGKPAGRSWMPDERGDELANSYMLDHTEFTCADIVERIGKTTAVWETGSIIFQEALKNVPAKNAKDEIGNAIICETIWKSTENTYKIYQIRQNWDDAKKEMFFNIATDELKILENVLPYIERDSRQGYHAEPHFYMFNAEKVRNKIETLNKLLKTS